MVQFSTSPQNIEIYGSLEKQKTLIYQCFLFFLHLAFSQNVRHDLTTVQLSKHQIFKIGFGIKTLFIISHVIHSDLVTFVGISHPPSVVYLDSSENNHLNSPIFHNDSSIFGKIHLYAEQVHSYKSLFSIELFRSWTAVA